MGLTDYLILAIFVLILGFVIFYIIKEKKKGTVCIGCPHAGTCQKNKCSGSCNQK